MSESIELASLMLQALKPVPVQEIFARDPYESRRTALKGEKLLHVLVIYQILKNPCMRGLVRAIAEHAPLQAALGGPVARNTLSNALAHRPVGQMLEVWMLLKDRYGAGVERLGKNFARIALIDSSLLQLSLAAYAWAEYRQGSGAAKLHAVLEWSRRIPEQLVVTPGKLHDMNRAVQMHWQAGWTYVQDRGYVGFQRLQRMRECQAHFVVRLKRGMHWTIRERRPVPAEPQRGGVRVLSDWTVRMAGWPEVESRLVSYRLPDGRVVRVLTDRLDLTALSVAQLYKERWKIENWWRGIKGLLKIKRPLGESQNALQLQLVAAFVTDLLWRIFKTWGRFPSGLYDFVTRGQELSLVRLSDVAPGAFRRALENILRYLNHLHCLPQLL
jgi:DDE family transposase